MLFEFKANEEKKIEVDEDRRVLFASVSLKTDGEFTLTLNGTRIEHLFLSAGIPHTYWTAANNPLLRPAQIDQAMIKKSDQLSILATSDGALRIDWNE